MDWIVEAILCAHMTPIYSLNLLENCLPRPIDHTCEPLLFDTSLRGPPNFLHVGICQPATAFHSGIISFRLTSIEAGYVWARLSARHQMIIVGFHCQGHARGPSIVRARLL